MVSSVGNSMPYFGSGCSGVSTDGGAVSGTSIRDIRHINNIPFYLQSVKAVMNEATTGVTLRSSGEVTNFNFLGGTFLEKFIDKNCLPETKAAIKGFDKSLIASETSQKAIEKLSGCKFGLNNAGRLVLNATEEAAKINPARVAAGKLAADVLGSTTRLGLMVSAIAEAPDLYDAYKNGDLGNQAVRSSTRVAASSIAFGTIIHLARNFAPTKIRTLAMFGAGIAGSIAAAKATDKFLDKTMGKSIKAQKLEAKKNLEESKNNKTVTT